MEDIELDGAESVSGPAPGSDAPTGSYSLDLDSTEQPSYRQPLEEAIPAAPRAPQLPASLTPEADPKADVKAAMELARQADQRAQMGLAAITPYLAALQQQALGKQEPPIDLQQILHDPNVTTEQLIKYIDQATTQKLTHQQQLMEMTARRGASEQYTRGLFSGEGFEGRDFDTMRTKYVAPVLERIPYLRDVLTTLNPEQPALMEYGLAALLELSARSKEDPVAFYKNLWAVLDNHVGADQGQKIQQAARAAAKRIAPARATGRQPSARTQGVTAPELEQMSDRDFDQLDRELTGGL